MFGHKSRYKEIETVNARNKDRREVTAVKLRQLSKPAGVEVMITDGNQLDVMSEQRYNDPARFWHIADANTELEAEKLTEQAARVIKVPERI
jgi:hypothetical protein